MLNVETIYDRIASGGSADFSEVLSLAVNLPKPEFYGLANRIREFFLGNFVETCSIMNARSGLCSEDCKWCAQSGHYKTGVDTYGYVSQSAAVNEAKKAAENRVRRFSLVTSGKTVSDANVERLARAFEAMGKVGGIELCGSFGLLSKVQLQRLKEAGLTRYHCNLEAAPSFFPNLCSTHTIEEKLETISHARDLGIEICSGGIIGMGETLEQRIELAFAIGRTGAVSVPVNILQPIKGTPLEKQLPLSEDEILTAFAVFRIVNPKAHIRFAGGRSSIRAKQELALRAGVSAMLVGDMLTTVGSNIQQDYEMLARLGYEH